MIRLDRTEQRIVGTLIEKQLSVPDSYPLTENALVDGCNQKSNRDPVTDLQTFEVTGALMALQERGVAARVEGGGRVARFRHCLADELGVGDEALAVLAELLLRGPQAPGALKPRVARMGFHASAERIEAVLHQLAQHAPPLVALLPLGPRERDRRWRHLLGDPAEAPAPPAGVTAPPAGATAPSATAAPASGASTLTTPGAEPDPLLEARVAALEQKVAALQDLVRQLGERGANG